jgi:hypothetical protein
VSQLLDSVSAIVDFTLHADFDEISPMIRSLAARLTLCEQTRISIASCTLDNGCHDIQFI